MVDLVTAALLAASAFFVILSLGLLFRYRQVSRHISSSSDIGSDLWRALETRLTKQDERILDMMSRVEVIQSRVVEGVAQESQASSHVSSRVTPRTTLASNPSDELYRSLGSRLAKQEERLLEMVNRLEAIQSRLNASHVEPVPLPVQRPVLVSGIGLAQSGSKEVEILKMLDERARTSVEIRHQFSVTREHSARLLKGLFDKGLVVRNDSHKPFVYDVTEAGRRYLASKT
jgi:hypothetical protein